jgi:hypothetical protein
MPHPPHTLLEKACTRAAAFIRMKNLKIPLSRNWLGEGAIV